MSIYNGKVSIMKRTDEVWGDTKISLEADSTGRFMANHKPDCTFLLNKMLLLGESELGEPEIFDPSGYLTRFSGPFIYPPRKFDSGNIVPSMVTLPLRDALKRLYESKRGILDTKTEYEQCLERWVASLDYMVHYYDREDNQGEYIAFKVGGEPYAIMILIKGTEPPYLALLPREGRAKTPSGVYEGYVGFEITNKKTVGLRSIPDDRVESLLSKTRLLNTAGKRRKAKRLERIYDSKDAQKVYNKLVGICERLYMTPDVFIPNGLSCKFNDLKPVILTRRNEPYLAMLPSDSASDEKLF